MKIKYLIYSIFLSISILSYSLALDIIEQRTLAFQDKCQIELLPNGGITIHDQDETLNFDDTTKAVFNSGTGETVIEYSGIATDKNEKRSWAKVIFAPDGRSLQHHHSKLVEDYYIIFAKEKLSVFIDNVEHFLSAGDHIQILPGQKHRVVNRSQQNECSLIVKCTPSWIVSDHILDPQ